MGSRVEYRERSFVTLRSDEFRTVSEQALAETDRGTAVAQWLRCCATNLKVAGSILDGVTGIFH